MSWTEERVSLLKQLWGEGKSAAEIAKALGGGLTRNAVIGKAHRLKLSNRVSPIQQNSKTPDAAPVAVKAAVRVVEDVAAPVRAAARVAIAIPQAANNGKGVSMVELKDRMCRWPVGDPKDSNFHFCGCSSEAGLPYCGAHAKIAYQAPSRSRQLNAEDFEREGSAVHAEEELKDVVRA